MPEKPNVVTGCLLVGEHVDEARNAVDVSHNGEPVRAKLLAEFIDDGETPLTNP